MDILPTVLAAANVPVPETVDGRSFHATLVSALDEDLPERDLFFGRREGGHLKGKTIEAVRRGPWKLLRSRPDGPLELFNLDTDPREEDNVADRNPEKFEELKRALGAQLNRYRQVPWRPPGRVD